MGPNTYIVAGFLIGLGLVVGARTLRVAISGRSDRDSWRRIEQRLVEINGSSDAADRSRFSVSVQPTPRARLARDTSVVLVSLGSVLVVAQALSELGASSGEVLDLTGVPAQTRPTAPAALTNESPARSSASEPVATPATPLSAPIQTESSRPDASSAAEEIEAPQADRLALLHPCPDEPGCYVYVVRHGDNLVSIAAWFGIPYGTILAFNSQLADPSTLRVGDVIRLPEPSR